MRAHRSWGLLALGLVGLACGGGGDGKTGLRVKISIDDAVADATVESITTFTFKVDAGATHDEITLPINGSLEDREITFRYLDDGRFAGMAVSLLLEMKNAGNQIVFSDVKQATFAAGETTNVDYEFGGPPPVDGGVDSGSCPTPVVCVNPGPADKACIDGTVIDFGNEAVLMNAAVELTMLDSRTGTLIGNGTVDSCGRFATGPFTPPLAAGAEVDLTVDDGPDNFKRTVTRFVVGRGTVLNGQRLRVMTTALDNSLSMAAGLCTGTCSASSTFAGQGSVALFYRHLNTLTRSVRVTRAPFGTKPVLTTMSVFYFTDDAAGKQSMVGTTATETTRSGAAIATVPMGSSFVWAGTGGLPDSNLAWKDVTVSVPTGTIFIADVNSTPHTCDPLAQATTGCLNMDDGCYPDTRMVGRNFCVHAGSTGPLMPCTAITSCSIGTTCDSSGTPTCRTLCRVGGGTPSCTGGLTCQALAGASANVGTCK